MHRWASLLILLAALAATLAGQQPDPLARARLLYNERDLAGAIEAATEARGMPGRADSADLVAARAFLERYRESAAESDLQDARVRLRRLNPARFDSQERSEFIIGLGAALYFEDLPGAAASVFESLMDDPNSPSGPNREGLLDWWASALDRDARPRSEPERQQIYRGVLDRMHKEIAVNPASSVAAYWLAAAAAGAGDWKTAWDQAQAGWVRAPLTLDHGAVLMADLDRLVQRAIAPERAKAISQSPDVLLQEWALFKERWTK
jgi:hypothetical protein